MITSLSNPWYDDDGSIRRVFLTKITNISKPTLQIIEPFLWHMHKMHPRAWSRKIVENSQLLIELKNNPHSFVGKALERLLVKIDFYPLLLMVFYPLLLMVFKTVFSLN